MSHLTSRALVVLCSSALLTACGGEDSTTPTTPTPSEPRTATEVFTGQINRNGAFTHPFLAASAGTVEATLDVGFGLRPELVSQGFGAELMRAVLSFADERFDATRYRVAIASFNERSRRLCESAGFRVVLRFEGPRRHFDELERAVHLTA